MHPSSLTVPLPQDWEFKKSEVALSPSTVTSLPTYSRQSALQAHGLVIISNRSHRRNYINTGLLLYRAHRWHLSPAETLRRKRGLCAWQYIWHSKEFASNMAVSTFSCTCVFKPVTGNIYEIIMNLRANKSTQADAQRWTWGCPATSLWEESCVLKVTTIAGGLQQNPAPLSFGFATQKGSPWASTQTNRDKSIARSSWARV